AALLAHGHVDAVHGLAGLIELPLVDDGVDRHSALARLAVADDELALPATDGDHGVDGLDAGLQRLLHGLTEDHTGGLALQGHLVQLTSDGAFAVDGMAQGVDHAAHHALTHPDTGDALGALHGVVLLDAHSGAQE